MFFAFSQNRSMKTSFRVWLVIFIVSLVGSVLLSRYVLDGISFENGLNLQFSTLGIIGLIFTAINLLSGTIVFFKFLKTQPFNRLLFFSTIPIQRKQREHCFPKSNIQQSERICFIMSFSIQRSRSL